jgi:hypothetical protein
MPHDDVLAEASMFRIASEQRERLRRISRPARAAGEIVRALTLLRMTRIFRMTIGYGAASR